MMGRVVGYSGRFSGSFVIFLDFSAPVWDMKDHGRAGRSDVDGVAGPFIAIQEKKEMA